MKTKCFGVIKKNKDGDFVTSTITGPLPEATARALCDHLTHEAIRWLSEHGKVENVQRIDWDETKKLN